MPQFTKSQNAAADTWGKDVLVAAGAGSGKTTVLAERIIRRIKAGADITDFLVVTFTVASAADLREKIGKNLQALCAEFPEESRYRRQLFTLYSASIGTISSICLKQVKQSAAALGIPAESHVGDVSLCASMLSECAEKALDSYCETHTDKAALLLDNFASYKNDKDLIKSVIAVYEGLRSFPFYKSWLTEQMEFCKADAAATVDGRYFESRDGKVVKEHLNKLLLSAIQGAKAMANAAEKETEERFAEKVGTTVTNIYAALQQGYEPFCEAVALIPPLTSPKKPSDQFTAGYRAANANCLKLLGDYCRGKVELVEEYSRIAELTEAFAELLILLDELYSAAKREKAFLDFADAEQFFLQLLAEKTDKGLIRTPFCRAVSARYSDVFIDEYQDVSPLQDMIFALIGEGKRFMVGDVKQSIYGFRDAYPDIFINYRDSFAPVEENGDTACILLNENFRCDRNVINFCNHVFNRIYTPESAGSDYTKEALVMGKEKSDDEKMCVAVFENRVAADNDEYTFMANEVVKLCATGVAPSDIAVLGRNAEVLARAAEALDAVGVPYTTKSKKKLLETPEVMLAIALLRAVDNPTEDISLAAILRSPLFCFTAEELVKIRKGTDSLYSDLCRAAEGSYPRGKRYGIRKAGLPARKAAVAPRLLRRGDSAIAKKCAAFLSKLNAFRDKSVLLPAHRLLMHIYEETDIFAHAPEGNEDSFMANLYTLYELTKSVAADSYKGISVITDYITRLSESGKSPESPDKTADGAVTLVTMHSSKGLEFPYVFLTGAGKQPRNTTSPTYANFKGGICFNLQSQKEATSSKTLHKTVLDADEKRRRLAEDLRVLYVAFTRAKKKLYITASKRHTLADFEKYSVKKYNCHADLFMNVLLEGDESFEMLVFPEGQVVEPQGKYTPKNATELSVEIPPLSDMEKSVPVTAKYFVSATHRGADGLLELAEGDLISDRVPVFATEGGKKSGAQIGSANHAFMQFADYGAAEKDVAAEARRLLERGFLSKEEFGLLRYEMLSRFFGSDIYRRMKASPRVYREKRFSTQLDASLFTKQEGQSVLVQGVIDCFFENEDGSFTLVDYKTDSAREGDEARLLEKHGTQLYLYSLYIKKLTGKPVSEAYIYSFALGKAIKCEEGITE